MIGHFTAAVRNALNHHNFYAAIATALTLPDICGAISHPEARGSQARYVAWWEENMQQYNGFISPRDSYALRCSYLHLGMDEIDGQRAREWADAFRFMYRPTEQAPFIHLVAETRLFGGGLFAHGKPTVLMVDTMTFCSDIADQVDAWDERGRGHEGHDEAVRRLLHLYVAGGV